MSKRPQEEAPKSPEQLSPAEKRAASWLRAAKEEYGRRYHEKKSTEEVVEVPPSPKSLPTGIDSGSMDADIWQGEEAGDYEEIVVGGMTSFELGKHVDHVNRIGRVEGQILNGYFGDPDSKDVEGFSRLEEQRQKALAEQEPDPLNAQIAALEAFKVI